MAPPDQDPFVRWNVDPGGVSARWDGPGATALLHVGRHGAMTLTVLGDPQDAAPLVATAVAERGPRIARLTLPRGALPLLADDVARRVGDGADWDWMWTPDPPPSVPGEDRVDVVDDDAAVAALLRAASARPSAQPGDPRVTSWLGVRSDGELVACGAATTHVPGVPHLASITTAPARRGEGLGAAVTAALTRRSMDAGAEVATLGMYADNAVARRLYSRLGYRCEHRFSSRALLQP